MNALTRLIRIIGSIGIAENESVELRRRKEFFNIVTVVGGLASIPQAITAFQFDNYAGILHLTWGFFCIFSVFVHHFGNFNIARIVTFVPVFILGNLAAARIGPETYSHLASLTIFVCVFILHDPRKEWPLILLYLLLEIAGFILIESNYMNVVGPNHGVDTFGMKIFNFIGTLIFISIELIFFIQMMLNNEREINRTLRETNETLNQRNEEKDLLLKEIHHRVKNNLQIISSLLRLQSHEIQDPFAREKFLDSVNRIKSISNLHEMIYRSENLFDIDMNHYLNNLAKSLIESYTIEKSIELKIHSELKKVQNDSIVPISLILNEMILNSLKHGFSGSHKGQIHVTIVQLESKNHYRLTYSDSGSWVPATRVDSFGTELIQSLVEQLNGVIERKPTSKKTEYSIKFEVAESEAM